MLGIDDIIADTGNGYWLKVRNIKRRTQKKDENASREYAARNKEARKAYAARLKLERPEAMRRMWRNASRKKMLDPNKRILSRLRIKLCKTVNRSCKSGTAIKLLGCSITDFWMYLESRFEPGMTRENYGEVWHVDHIMPCAIFDLTKPEHQKRCFHFSNLQPLFARDNLIKNDKIVTDQFNLL